MRYKIKFSYDGSKFNGYQKQKDTLTIQGELESALKKINSNKDVKVVASGRTDAKVHAYNQVAHFDLDSSVECSRLKQSLNDLISDYIYIKDVVLVNEDFHARFSIKSKEYIYKINIGEYNPIERDYVLQYNKELDTDSMKEALNFLKGTHSFKSFTKCDKEREDYVRTILSAKLSKDKDIIIVSIVGTGFMRYMVRNIVGMLIEIGEGKRKSKDIISVLKKEDRKEAGICAEACGLYLKDVNY